MPEYGSGGDLTVIMEGPFSGGGGTAAKIGSFNAPAADWKGATSPYSQIVQVDGVSVNSKLDLQLNVDQMELFHNQDITFSVANRGGVVSIYAVGDKPAADSVFTATISEVIATGEGGEIWGNPVSTSSPRTDLNQTDPAKVDYLKGREMITNMVRTARAVLSSSGWINKSQTVAVAGVVAGDDKQAIVTVADADSLEVYLDCNIRLTGNGEGNLTFECDDVPGSNVDVNVLILTKGGM
jgi:hypothetical protein